MSRALGVPASRATQRQALRPPLLGVEILPGLRLWLSVTGQVTSSRLHLVLRLLGGTMRTAGKCQAEHI